MDGELINSRFFLNTATTARVTSFLTSVVIKVCLKEALCDTFELFGSDES